MNKFSLNETTKKITKNKLKIIYGISIVFILSLAIFLRAYELEERLQFTWDQIENAWMMKDMILEGKRPLLGMQAKGASGFFVGPSYYYLLVPFYYVFNLDPIAGGFFSLSVSIVTVSVLLFVVHKVFGLKASVVSGFIYATSQFYVFADRVAWPVIVLPAISLIIFYSLIKIVRGNTWYLPLAAFLSGFAFHMHFTAIFYPIIIFLCLPFFKREKRSIAPLLVSVPAFFIWFLPIILANQNVNGVIGSNFLSYISTYYHGFHLRRVLQIAPDIFGEIGEVLKPFDRPLVYFIPLLFMFSVKKHIQKNWVQILYITSLFFIVPLLVLSTYSGELTSYYYTIARPLIAIMISVILVQLINNNKFRFYIVGVVLFIYSFLNIQFFLNTKHAAYPRYKSKAAQGVELKLDIKFSMGDPVSYLYYYYLYRENGVWPNW